MDVSTSGHTGGKEWVGAGGAGWGRDTCTSGWGAIRVGVPSGTVVQADHHPGLRVVDVVAVRGPVAGVVGLELDRD